MRDKLTRGGWLVTVPASIMAVAYVALVFLPRMGEIRELRQELVRRREFVTHSGRLRPAAELASRELRDTEAYCQKWRGRTIDETDLQSEFSIISQLAEASGVKVVRFEPQPSTQYEQLRKVPVLLSVEGSFAAIQQLAQKLDELPASVWIDHLSMQNPGENGEAVKAEWKLVLFADNPKKSD